MKKWFTISLAVLLVFALAACSTGVTTTTGTTKGTTTTGTTTAGTTTSQQGWQRDPNLNPLGEFPICKETVSLKIGMPQMAAVENFETNWQTLQLEEKGNFDLSFEMYAGDEIVQKIELMIVAGGNDLPDVIMHGLGGQANLVKYGQAGMILPLNDYYENSAYWINDSLSRIELDVFKYVTSYDGNIYGMFRMLQSLNNEYSPARLMLFEPWLESLDLKMPETTEEFLNVLRAMKNDDPNGNGQADEIPLAGYKDVMSSNYANFMMTSFVYTHSPDYWTNTNGTIGVAFTTDEWREGLRYTKQLVDENLMTPLSFTQDRPQLVTMLSTDPTTVGVFVGVSTSLMGAEDARRTQYAIVPPLEGPTGRKEAYWNPTLPNIGMVITKNCASPEAAFSLGDLLCSEEFSVMTRWGEKGVDWLVPDAGAKSVYDALGYAAIIEPVTPWGGLQNKWWAQAGVYLVDYRWAVGQVSSGSPFDHNYQIGLGIGPSIEYRNSNPVVGIIYNEAEQEVMTELQNTILTYVKESFARFIMGDMSLDTEWDKYVNEFKNMGLEETIAATQSAYDRMNG